MNARILAIDLTNENGSIALVENGRVVNEAAIESKDGYGHVMFQAIDSLLNGQHWTLDSIDCFAVAHGPGSFTGVRVGVAAAKGFAAAMSKPVVCVSNLRAIAAYGSGPVRAAMIDAHREEIYGGVFDGALNPLTEELVIKRGPWLEMVPEGAEFISANAELFAGWVPQITTAPRALAGAVGRIAAMDLDAGKAIEAAAAETNYVRRSDAEMFVSSYRPLVQSK